VVRAQQNNHRIGVIIGYAENDPETRARLEAFRRGLAKRAWSEDHNIHIDFASRWVTQLNFRLW
jgi:DNA-binding LacI/PurR family transcriptional regulator